MAEVRIAAYADEAADALSDQIAALAENNLRWVELRGVAGRNVTAWTKQEATEIGKALTDHGISVWALGSPFGKTPLDAPFEESLDTLKRLIDTAHILGTGNIRVFSFYPKAQDDPDACLPQVIERLGQACNVAQQGGVSLCHENEKGIVGDTPGRCRRLLDALPALRGVFDPANFIQCGIATWPAWETLRDRIYYLHIKDALADGAVVAAGQGIGQVADIVHAYLALPDTGGMLTVEPHLPVQAQAERPQTVPVYPSRRAAFAAAVRALRGVMERST